MIVQESPSHTGFARQIQCNARTSIHRSSTHGAVEERGGPSAVGTGDAEWVRCDVEVVHFRPPVFLWLCFRTAQLASVDWMDICS